jgi:hypothetical protein
MLGSPNSAVREFLRGDGIDALLHEHWAGRATSGMPWALLSLEVLLRQRL